MSASTFQVALCDGVQPTQAALTLLRKGVLDLCPQRLVHQCVVPAVQPRPGGDPLPAHGAAQCGFIHRLQEAALGMHGHGG